MSEKYFSKFPLITYNNQLAVNITERVVVRDFPTAQAFLYYPYDIKSFERPDQLADRILNEALAEQSDRPRGEVIDLAARRSAGRALRALISASRRRVTNPVPHSCDMCFERFACASPVCSISSAAERSPSARAWSNSSRAGSPSTRKCSAIRAYSSRVGTRAGRTTRPGRGRAVRRRVTPRIVLTAGPRPVRWATTRRCR